MAQQTVNPYPDLGAQFQAGMNAIIAALPPSPTVDDLVHQVVIYVETLFYTAAIEPAQKIEVKSVAYSAINSYIDSVIINPKTSLYKGSQNPFLYQMLGPSLINEITVDSIGNRIADIEDNITKSGLSVEEQTPLLMATMIGATANTYLLNEIALGGASLWINYFNAAQTSPTANLPFWVSIAMEGALIGAKSTKEGMIETTEQIVTTEIISALTAALTIAAGKVIFMWIPKVKDGDRDALMKSHEKFGIGSGIITHQYLGHGLLSTGGNNFSPLVNRSLMVLGFYTDTVSILGDDTAENNLLNFASSRGFQQLEVDGLGDLFITNETNSDNINNGFSNGLKSLARFINKARTQYGINLIGPILQSVDDCMLAMSTGASFQLPNYQGIYHYYWGYNQLCDYSFNNNLCEVPNPYSNAHLNVWSIAKEFWHAPYDFNGWLDMANYISPLRKPGDILTTYLSYNAGVFVQSMASQILAFNLNIIKAVSYYNQGGSSNGTPDATVPCYHLLELLIQPVAQSMGINQVVVCPLFDMTDPTVTQDTEVCRAYLIQNGMNFAENQWAQVYYTYPFPNLVLGGASYYSYVNSNDFQIPF
jgi:hypothetical protein